MAGGGDAGDSDLLLVYDDECGFCTWWAAAITARSPIEAIGFDALADAHRHRLPDDYEHCVHLLTPTGVHSCGAAAEAALVRLEWVPSVLETPGPFRQCTPYRWLRERVYRWMANHRGLLGRFFSRERL